MVEQAKDIVLSELNESELRKLLIKTRHAIQKRSTLPKKPAIEMDSPVVTALADHVRATAKDNKVPTFDLVDALLRSMKLKRKIINDAKRNEKKKAARYVDPDNDKNVWSGSGRRPEWLMQKLKEGRKLIEFKV